MRTKRGEKKILRKLGQLLKRYIANCSIHGVRHIVEDDRHWTERLFWMVACGLSWYGCILMIWGVVEDFDNRRVAVTVDTNHLNFVPGFPAIHICSKAPPPALEFASKTWSKMIALKILSPVGAGFVSFLENPTDNSTFEKVANGMYLNCSEIFKSCIWDEKEIDCCEAFRPILIPEMGCLSTNSIYAVHSEGMSDYDEKTFHVTPTRKRRLLKIRFVENKHWRETKKNIYIYITGNMELPLTTSSAEEKLNSVWKSLVQNIDILQQPIYNRDAVRNVPIEKRNCRFPDENKGHELYPVYGYDACIVEKTMWRMYEQCSCIGHLYPRISGMSVCNNELLPCVSKVTINKVAMELPSCLSDCVETSYDFFTNNGEEETAGIDINMLPGPTKKYVRYVVSTKLDLMVGVGSALGLFVGASILSIVEIPYWFIVRSIDDNDPDDADGEDYSDNREKY